MRKKQTVFVIAARIAAHLHFATKVAQQLSLTAKNARAITARAGQQAVGFTAITGFIQELASTTIVLAQEINVTAISISRQATQLERVKQVQRRFSNAQSLGLKSHYIDTIKPLIIRNDQDLSLMNKEFHILQTKLSDLIEQTQKQIRSASVISSMSKIEASKSGSFQSQLEVIAGNIFEAASDIKSELASAESLLATTK